MIPEVWDPRILGSQKSGIPEFWDPRVLGSQNSGIPRVLGSQNSWNPRILGSQNIWDPRILGIPEFWDPRILGIPGVSFISFAVGPHCKDHWVWQWSLQWGPTASGIRCYGILRAVGPGGVEDVFAVKAHCKDMGACQQKQGSCCGI